jgi:hypothetical protein
MNLTPWTNEQLRNAHPQAARIADAMADEMRRNLEVLTPEGMGLENMSPEELIASEWQCWYYEEVRCGR